MWYHGSPSLPVLCICICIFVCICVCTCIVFVSYDDHVCASLPGPPLRARCLQSKMQIHDRVSGFSRKIEQIIALAPLVTNPLEKYIFSPKRFHLAVVAACMKRKTAKEESKGALCQTKAIHQNQHIEAAEQTHFGEVVLAWWVKITLRRLCRKLGEEEPLSPRLSGGASTSSRQGTTGRQSTFSLSRFSAQIQVQIQMQKQIHALDTNTYSYTTGRHATSSVSLFAAYL